VIEAKPPLILATETGRPIADTANRIEGQFVGTSVLGSDHLTVHHTSARDEFFTRVRMREIALVHATYGTLTREEEFTVEDGFADDNRRLILIIIIVNHWWSSRPCSRVHRRPVFRLRSLAASKVHIIS